MNLEKLLKDADPVVGEPSLPVGDVQRMRRTAIAAAEEGREPLAIGRGTVLAVATAAVVVAMAVGVSQWPRPGEGVDLAPPSVTETTVRQLQFSTPTGTRIIWIFNPEFQQ
jgi:hypothetical protein